MSEICREKYLDEYIADLDIDENVKKRMLALCEIEKNRASEREKYLHNCHMRIDVLEKTIVELGTELGKARRFIRERELERY